MQWQTWFGLESQLTQNRFAERKDKMQKKIKIEKYNVYEKGRTYEVLKFPFIKHMWAYDDHLAEKMLLVDGCKEAFEWIPHYLMYSKRNVEEILGDTVFLVRPRLEWLDYHYYMVQELEQYGKKGLGVVIVSMGNLLTEEDIQAMYEDVKKFPHLHL